MGRLSDHVIRPFYFHAHQAEQVNKGIDNREEEIDKKRKMQSEKRKVKPQSLK